MKPLVIAALGALLALSACQTRKSERHCQEDAERMRSVIRETAFFFEALGPELEAADQAAIACEDRLDACMAEDWTARLHEVRLQETDIRARFSHAMDVWDADACLPYTAIWHLNPPEPERYRGYYTTFEKAEVEIDRLIARLSLFVG